MKRNTRRRRFRGARRRRRREAAGGAVDGRRAPPLVSGRNMYAAGPQQIKINRQVLVLHDRRRPGRECCSGQSASLFCCCLLAVVCQTRQRAPSPRRQK